MSKWRCSNGSFPDAIRKDAATPALLSLILFGENNRSKSSVIFVPLFLSYRNLKTMGRIVAIDYGRKRTGLAVTDPLQMIAGALDTVPTHTLMDFLKKYLPANGVETVVVGHARAKWTGLLRNPTRISVRSSPGCKRSSPTCGSRCSMNGLLRNSRFRR